MLTWIPTPCVNICRMEGDKCAGCGRTLDQIANWAYYSDDEKWEIMEELLRENNVAKSSTNKPIDDT